MDKDGLNLQGDKPLPVSVILLTLNEEHHLAGVLQNVGRWAEDVFIVDSLSTDRTVDIALEYGARVVQRPFTNFGDQWNWALSHLPLKTTWTLKLDPDERLTAELKSRIGAVVYDPNALDGYVFPRRLWFMGKPLHVHADVLRLWRTGRCRFSDVIVNEHPLIDGKVGQLKGLMEHLESPDLHHWFEKQNRYTTMEAIMRTRGDAFAVEPRLFGSPLERRMVLKRVFFRIPFRYELQLLHELFARGTWRDGMTGLAWARLRVHVRRTIELKAREMRTTGRIPTTPRGEYGSYDPRVLASELQQELLPETCAVLPQDCLQNAAGS